MKKAAKKTSTKTTAKKKTNGGSKAGGKSAQVIALMQRPKGCTREEVLVLTGWKAVSMQQLATNAGVKLKIDDSERPYRYRTAG
jgi:hypothetical protein